MGWSGANCVLNLKAANLGSLIKLFLLLLKSNNFIIIGNYFLTLTLQIPSPSHVTISTLQTSSLPIDFERILMNFQRIGIFCHA